MAATVPALPRDPRTERARVFLSALALALAPVLLVVGSLINLDTGDKAAHEVAKISAHRGQFVVGSILFALGAAALVPGALALSRLARARGAAFMTTGTCMVALGGGCLAAALAVYASVGYIGTEPKVPQSGTIAIVDHAQNSLLVGSLWILGIGALIGLMVCAVGLLRARTVPRWEAILLLIAPVISFFGNHGVLGAALGLPLAVALIALAYEVVRPRQPAEIDLTDAAAGRMEGQVAPTPAQRAATQPANSPAP